MRQRDKEKQEAIDKLREWLKPGDTVYTILRHVSRSGMQREIGVVIIHTDPSDPLVMLHPNYSVAKAIGARLNKHGDGIIIGGCGMDMGFHVVNSLSSVLYGYPSCPKCGEVAYTHEDSLTAAPVCPKCGAGMIGGYKCLGKNGHCPSNYHSNHHDRIRCEGTRVYNPEGPDTGEFCYCPGSFFGPAREIPADWPRATSTIRGVRVKGQPLYCVGDGADRKVCPKCKGIGTIPNPDGPERFDLWHTDGYALKHRWL